WGIVPVTYYRKNQFMANGLPCGLSVPQAMRVVCSSNPAVSLRYKQNTLEANIYPWEGSREVGSKRDTQQEQRKVWPRLEPPTNVTASVQSATTIHLSWVKASPDLTKYQIQRSANGAPFIVINNNVSKTAVTYDDSTATLGTKYQYCIQAVWSTPAFGGMEL